MALETTYIVTAKKSGTITFKYDLNGNLIMFQFEGDALTPEQAAWLYQRIPVKEKQMNMWQAIKEFTVTKGEPDLSFKNFWDTYDEKHKKIPTQKLWEKLSADDKFNAIAYIRRYNNALRLKGTAKALPDTYLRQKRWLDEL